MYPFLLMKNLVLIFFCTMMYSSFVLQNERRKSVKNDWSVHSAIPSALKLIMQSNRPSWPTGLNSSPHRGHKKKTQRVFYVTSAVVSLDILQIWKLALNPLGTPDFTDLCS